MADISPINTTLADLREGDQVHQEFTAVLTEPNSNLISISIIDYQSTPGIEVLGSLYQGKYESIFDYGNDALKYRLGDDIALSASKWEDLPTSKDTQLWLWQAPSSLQRTFTYTVLMKYTITTQPPAGDTTSVPTVTEHELTKIYSQDVFGNWSKWGDMLRDYVRARN